MMAVFGASDAVYFDDDADDRVTLVMVAMGWSGAFVVVVGV